MSLSQTENSASSEGLKVPSLCSPAKLHPNGPALSCSILESMTCCKERIQRKRARRQ